jgi:hypothetical protein
VSLLLDTTEFVETLKKSAVAAVEATKPVNVCFGKVTSKSPLKISTEQKMLLSANQLILTRNVTDYEEQVTVEWETEDGSPIKGKKKMKVHNGLTVGDSVLLLRQQGGQKFVVLDRMG